MKILLIQASQRNDSGKILKAEKLWISGVTLPYLAALTPKDIEVDLSNELVEDIDFDCPHDLIGITTMGCSISRGFEIADRFRKAGKTVVLGGIPITLFPQEALKHADSIVIGEAELVWPDILKDFEKGNLQNVYQADRLCDLKTIPSPRYDLLDERLYAPIRPVEASRGCPHKCYFCSPAHFYKGKHRVRSIDGILRDIETIKNSGIRRILFIDDAIDGNKKFFKELLREMIPLKVSWFSQSTVQVAKDEQLVDLMAQSGCEALSIGFESINQNSLRAANKKHNLVNEYKTLVDNLRRKGIMVNALIMFGFDEDDETIFDTTFEFFDRIGVVLPELFILVPPPGTDLYDDFEREGRLLHKDWSRYKVTEVVYNPKHMTPKTLQEGFWKTYEKFYTFRSILKRVLFHNRMYFFNRKFLIRNSIAFYFNIKYRKKILKERVHPGVV